MSNVFIRNSSVEGFCCCWGFVLFWVFFVCVLLLLLLFGFCLFVGFAVCLFFCFCVSFEGFGWLVCLEVVLVFVHVRINLFLISSLRHRDTTKKPNPLFLLVITFVTQQVYMGIVLSPWGGPSVNPDTEGEISRVILDMGTQEQQCPARPKASLLQLLLVTSHG